MYTIFVSSHIILDMIGFVRHQKSCRIGLDAALAHLWTEASGRYLVVLCCRGTFRNLKTTLLWMFKAAKRCTPRTSSNHTSPSTTPHTMHQSEIVPRSNDIASVPALCSTESVTDTRIQPKNAMLLR